MTRRNLLRRAEAETTAEADAAQLAALGPPGRERARMRRHAALLTRSGEKRLLRDVLQTLERLREETAADES